MYFLYIYLFIFVLRKEYICVVSGKRVFTGGTDGDMCCDNSPWRITEVPVLGEVRGKS